MARLIFLALLSSTLFAQSFVFVHVGPNLPSYLPTAIQQVRLFNKECPVYVIAAMEELKKIPSGLSFSPVPIESLERSSSHEKFIQEGKNSGFWRYTTERFFYLDSFVRKYQLTDVIHLENDVMLYADIKELLPIFRLFYKGMIGATFDNDYRCIPGFVFISDANPLDRLVRHIAEMAKFGANDMQLLGHFKNTYYKIYCDYLPIIMPRYDRPFRNALGWSAVDPGAFYNHFAEFGSVFDAAALGQYIGGNDPIHPGARPGFVNESTIFDASLLEYEWKRDEQGRQIPYILYKGTRVRVNCLHIHCKNLNAFYSLNRQMPIFTAVR